MLPQRSGALVLFAAMGVAAYFLLAPRFPKDQSVNVVLGDSASDVTDVSIHYSSTRAKSEEWSRDVSFHYAAGAAPRVVHHEARLPDGEYAITIDLGGPRAHWSHERRVKLESSSSTSINVGSK